MDGRNPEAPRTPADHTRHALHAGWCRRLLAKWRLFNQIYARGGLSPAAIRLDQATVRLGSYDPARRVISISARHIAEDPWSDVLETLRHEMAHQYAIDVLRAGDESAHGAGFQRACEVLRVRAGARTHCDARDPEVALADTVLLCKVEKLLALGQSPNENEAEAAMRKARELMAQHEIDASAEPSAARYRTRQLGPMKQRHEGWEYVLSSILTQFFHVEAIWVHTYDARTDREGTVLEVCGTHTHLELAEYVHTYLWRLLPDLWTRYKRARDIARNSDRRSYFTGVLSGFEKRLTEQEASAPHAQALVLARRDSRLNDWYRYLYPSIHTVGGSSAQLTAAFGDGVADGRAISIRKPLQGGAGGTLLSGS